MTGNKINGLDLFSGIGGISLAIGEWVQTIAYCEQDRYAQAVLLSRMSEGKLDQAPIWDDIKTLKGEMLPTIDIIFGGFPCQDISVAGNGKGLAGERSGLFFEIIRLTKEIRPTFVFLENVPAIRTRGLEEVIRSFTEIGYDCRWTMLSASSIGAPHKRERWFFLAYNKKQKIVANTDRSRCLRKNSSQSKKWHNNIELIRSSKKMANPLRERLERQRKGAVNAKKGFSESGISRWWEVEPDFCRVADGVQFRVDRIKCLGNSVVQQQVKKAFKELIGLSLSKL